MNTAPIGIFDSGVGGFSVAREIRQLLPAEDLVYFADTAYCPYGSRSAAEVCARSLAVVDELVSRGVKMVVIACNTASGSALETVREAFSVPIVGLEPAVKPAAAATRNGRVGVLATAGTLASDRFRRLVETYAAGVQIVPQPGPGLVELVETGRTQGKPARETLTQLLAPLKEAGVDTLVLGCTHYPFLRPTISRIMGEEVQIIDSGTAVARQVRRVLDERDELAPPRIGSTRLITTGDGVRVSQTAQRLWPEPLYTQVVELETRV